MEHHHLLIGKSARNGPCSIANGWYNQRVSMVITTTSMVKKLPWILVNFQLFTTMITHVPSGNPTWKWKMHHCIGDFRRNLHSVQAFSSLPCLMTLEGSQYNPQLWSFTIGTNQIPFIECTIPFIPVQVPFHRLPVITDYNPIEMYIHIHIYT